MLLYGVATVSGDNITVQYSIKSRSERRKKKRRKGETKKEQGNKDALFVKDRQVSLAFFVSVLFCFSFLHQTREQPYTMPDTESKTQSIMISLLLPGQKHTV